MSDLTTKIIRKHRSDCEAIRQCRLGHWSTPWFLTGETEWRDTLGRDHPHGHDRWLVAVCNSIQCRARMIVRADPLEVRLATFDDRARRDLTEEDSDE